MTTFQYLRASLLGSILLVDKDYLDKMAAVLERRIIDGERMSAEDIAAIKYTGETKANGLVRLWEISAGDWNKPDVKPDVSADSRVATQQPAASNIAVINCFGLIAQHSSQVDNISGPGGTSTERVSGSLRQALADPSVKAIVMNIHSPGGSVFGVEELGNEMFSARAQKPLIAQINSMCGSAAYWLASQCEEICITPGGEVGSIGAYSMHEDASKAAEAAGFKFTFISAGKYKVEGNKFEPLSDTALAAQQKMVNSYYDGFVGAVARGRGVSSKAVRNGFGEGRMERAGDALKLGMADRVATLDQTLQRVGKMKAKTSTVGATAETITVNTRQDADGGRHLFLEGEFPPIVTIAGGLVINGDPAALCVDEAARVVTFEFENAVASYRIDKQDGDYLTCSRIPHVPIASMNAAAAFAEATRIAAVNADRAKDEAFRRRRYALRARAHAAGL